MTFDVAGIRSGAYMTAVILRALLRMDVSSGQTDRACSPHLAVLQAQIMISSSISPSLTSPVAVDWMMKTSSSRTDSPTVKDVSWFE